MKRTILWPAIAGSLFLTAGMAAAEPDVTWPAEWMAFGPDVSQYPQDNPSLGDLLPGTTLKTIPADLAVGTNRYRGLPVRLDTNLLDLATLPPPEARSIPLKGHTMYLLAPVTAVSDTTVQVGAGADWWMQWWLDGEPVYGTLGPYGNGAKAVTARDHLFELPLSRGAHVLAVAVVRGIRGFHLAVTSPRELHERPVTFREALAAGFARYTTSHWSIPIHYAAARNDFRQALSLAGTDEEQSDARLALADNYLLDVWETNPTNAPAVRREYEAVLALPGARADQKARAELGVGETLLLEHQCAAARKAFERALAADPACAPQARLATARAHIQEQHADAARDLLKPLLVDTNLDSRLRFDARLHLAALDVAPRIRADHPRLFFNADTWPALKASIERRTNTFEKLRQEVESLPDEFAVQDWGIEHWFQVDGDWTRYPDLMSAALVYRVTGDPALLAKVRGMLRATVDHYLRLDDFNGSVNPRVCWLAALDWVWHDLPAEERNGLMRDMLRFAYGWQVQTMRYGRDPDRDPLYYMMNMFWYVGLAALGPDLDPVDTLRALAVLGRGYENNVTAGFGRRLEVMQDRGMVTRPDYAFCDLPTPTWTFLHCWRAAVGPVPAEWSFASGVAPSCVLRYVLGHKANYYRDFGYAISWRKRGGWVNDAFLFNNLEQFIYFFAEAEPDEARIAAWLLERMKRAGSGGAGHYVVDSYVLKSGPAPEPGLPAGLPLARHYPTNGIVLMSSGFDPESSTYALYACGGGQVLAEHYDTGHFTIFKKGYLALDSGTRAMFGGNGENYDRQSVAHNTILIRMPGEVFSWENQPLKANSGGQRQFSQAARTLAFETGPHFAYTATDATETYHSNKCARMTRQFLFLPPDHVVVFDRVVSKQADYPKTWLLHTANEPALAGREFRADQDGGRLFCRTLLPADAVLEAVGGPGKEFWADGQNWPIPKNSPYLSNMGMKDASDVPENVGRWRVEVTPGTARTEDCFLHVIEVGDRTALNAMTPTALIEQDRTAGTEFQAGARTVKVLFNRTGDVGGHILIEEGGKTLMDKDLPGEVQAQSGLALEH